MECGSPAAAFLPCNVAPNRKPNSQRQFLGLFFTHKVFSEANTRNVNDFVPE